MQGGRRDRCRIVVVVEGEEEEEGLQRWEGADDHAVIAPPLRDPPARGSEHVVPPHLPPGNHTGRRVLRDGWQRDGEDHRRTLTTVIAVGPEDGRVRAHDRVVFWVRCVPASVPRAAARARCTSSSALLSCGTVLAYTYVWFLRCKKAVDKELLLGEYHEDFFQLLPALSVSCYGLSCGPGYWKFFSVPVLLAKTESLKLWILTR